MSYVSHDVVFELHRALELATKRAEAAEAALEIAREALDIISGCTHEARDPGRCDSCAARNALEQLPPRRTP